MKIPFAPSFSVAYGFLPLLVHTAAWSPPTLLHSRLQTLLCPVASQFYKPLHRFDLMRRVQALLVEEVADDLFLLTLASPLLPLFLWLVVYGDADSHLGVTMPPYLTLVQRS